ncbi:MAG TPA: redoxin domain-containing protein [Candidatus Deferrimicrobiaceae bacterium]|jgi:peroxiredoxin
MKLKALVMVAALSLGLSVFAYAADEEVAKAPEPIKYGQNIGDNLQPVVLSTVDGSKKVELAKLTEKSVFVMVSSVCTACRKELQELSENLERFKGKAEVYAVVIDMDSKTGAERIGNLPFTMLADPEQKIAQATNLGTNPSTLIVKDGKILYTKFGYKSNQWKEYLQER